MYNFVDQPHRRLARGSHVLLWAMRYWAICRKEGRCSVSVMGDSFWAMGLHEVLPDFDRLMRTFHRSGPHHLNFADHAHPVITESEAVLLALWCGVAEGEYDRAEAVLRLMIADDDVCRVVAGLRVVIDHMGALDLMPSAQLQSDRFGTVPRS